MEALGKIFVEAFLPKLKNPHVNNTYILKHAIKNNNEFLQI